MLVFSLPLRPHRLWFYPVRFTICTGSYGGGAVALGVGLKEPKSKDDRTEAQKAFNFNPYPTAFPYGNGMVLHFYQQQESSTTKTVHKVINKGLKTYV